MNSIALALFLACTAVAVSATLDYKSKRGVAGVAGVGLAGYSFPASAGVAPHPSFLTANPLTAAVPAVGSLVSPKGAYFPSVPSVAFAPAPYLAKPAYATSAYAPAAFAAPAYSTHAYAPALAAAHPPAHAPHGYAPAPAYDGHAAPAFAAHATPAFAAHAAPAYAGHVAPAYAGHAAFASPAAFAKSPLGYGYFG